MWKIEEATSKTQMVREEYIQYMYIYMGISQEGDKYYYGDGAGSWGVVSFSEQYIVPWTILVCSL